MMIGTMVSYRSDRISSGNVLCRNCAWISNPFPQDSLSESSSVHPRSVIEESHLVTGDDFSVITKMTLGTLTKEYGPEPDEAPAPKLSAKAIAAKQVSTQKSSKQPCDQKDDVTNEASLEEDDNPSVLPRGSKALQAEQNPQDDNSIDSEKVSLEPDDCLKLPLRGKILNETSSLEPDDCPNPPSRKVGLSPKHHQPPKRPDDKFAKGHRQLEDNLRLQLNTKGLIDQIQLWHTTILGTLMRRQGDMTKPWNSLKRDWKLKRKCLG